MLGTSPAASVTAIVSPMARLNPRMTDAMTPLLAAGRTTFQAASQRADDEKRYETENDARNTREDLDRRLQDGPKPSGANSLM